MALGVLSPAEGDTDDFCLLLIKIDYLPLLLIDFNLGVVDAIKFIINAFSVSGISDWLLISVG